VASWGGTNSGIDILSAPGRFLICFEFMGVFSAASCLQFNRIEVLGCTERSQREMYATRLMTAIYHLVLRGGQHTLCGLRISRVMSERKTNTLQLVADVTPNLSICKHCERIKRQDLLAN